ncbi:MAG: hypothetical protein ACOH5I_03205 [Oligoflexus sp.]
MKKWRSRSLGISLILAILDMEARSAYAVKKGSPLSLAADSNEVLMIPATDELLEKQKKLIFSGFPAYSLLDISYEEGDAERLVQVRTCSARYDLWEERIHILAIDGEDLNPVTLGNFDEYAKICLTIALSAEQRKKREKIQAKWLARLSLTQLTGEESQKIRDWLVKQQSGIIKGLFSHMLGDLTLSETTSFEFHTRQLRSKVDQGQEQHEQPQNRD